MGFSIVNHPLSGTPHGHGTPQRCPQVMVRLLLGLPGVASSLSGLGALGPGTRGLGRPRGGGWLGLGSSINGDSTNH